MAYYNIRDVSSTLRQLEALMEQPRIEPSRLLLPTTQPTSSPLEVQKIQPLQNRALTEYLRQRGISVLTARPYVLEIYYTRKEKNYFALAFLNESDGYELRNPYFKGVYGTKDITLIDKKNLLAKRKGQPRTLAVTVFEGFFDFLSALTHYGVDITTPVIVLNSVAMKDRVIETIREAGVGKVYLYLDRDKSGRELTAHFKRQLHDITLVDNSTLYADYKDFNEFLVAQSHQKKG
jgi:5S rRNA maturation endonuclease (ribonuclease M5)